MYYFTVLSLPVVHSHSGTKFSRGKAREGAKNPNREARLTDGPSSFLDYGTQPPFVLQVRHTTIHKIKMRMLVMSGTETGIEDRCSPEEGSHQALPALECQHGMLLSNSPSLFNLPLSVNLLGSYSIFHSSTGTSESNRTILQDKNTSFLHYSTRQLL